MKHLFTKRVLTSAVGILALAVILVCVNWAAKRFYVRADITEDKLYSLSQGTKNLLRNLPEDVTLKLFYSQNLDQQDPFIKAYAERVKDLLREYEQNSRGAITVEIYDPKQDSDEEEWAQKYGVAGNPINPLVHDELFYFGLVAEAVNRHKTIEVLAPQRERFLEYDISRMIYEVLHPDKKTIGIISSLPVLGSQDDDQMMMMMQRRRPADKKPAWVFVQELKKIYNVVSVPTNETVLPPALDLLMVIHPKALPAPLQFAIDQYVLAGGKAMIFVDPACNVDVTETGMGFQMPGSSSLNTLLNAWGVDVPEGKVVVDLDSATMVSVGQNRAAKVPTWITVQGGMLNQDDVIAAQLERMVIPVGGHVARMSAVTNTFEPLASSSKNVMEKDVFSAQMGLEQLTKDFQPAGTTMPLAVKVTGAFASAFPDGNPMDTNAPALRAAAKPTTVIVIGDVDLLADQFNFQEINIFGTRMYQPFNNNIDFVQNAVDQLCGDENLIAIRSRAKFQRPFVVVDELEKQAQQRWLDEEQRLNEELQTVRQQLSELQAKKDESQRFIISDEQKAQIERFRARQVEVAQNLKQVRKNLRKDIDQLGARVKFINIAAVPIGVCLFGIGLAWYRHTKGKQS
jgi:gliding-associated putative ABC transporter substrate-binding component GldG